MKKVRMFLAGILLLAAASAKAQSLTAVQLAGHIAQKMKDTLDLTVQQQAQLNDINMNIHNRKMGVRQQYTSQDSIRIKTQQVENGRDSLYRGILPAAKYTLYLQKKRSLVSAN